MGILDDATSLAGKAVDAVGGDKVKEGIDTATDLIDAATGGASSSVTEQVDDAAGNEVDKLANG
jgi:hypothetical protein